jgi:TPR repeat protein
MHKCGQDDRVPPKNKFLHEVFRNASSFSTNQPITDQPIMYKHILLTLFVFLFSAELLTAQDTNGQQEYKVLLEEQENNSIAEGLRKVQEYTGGLPDSVKKNQMKASANIVCKFSKERQKRILSKLPQELRKQFETELTAAENAELNRAREELVQKIKEAYNNPKIAFRLAMLRLPPEFLKPIAQDIQKNSNLKPDPKEAYKYFNLAHEKGINNRQYDGLFGLGICYAEGFGVEKDPKRAEDIFKKTSGHVLSEVDIFLQYDPNETPAKRESAKQKADAALKAQSLKAKAITGDTEAEREYGIYLIDAEKTDILDEGGIKDAARYLYLAAQKGDKEAQFQLGKLYVKHNWGAISLIPKVNRETAIQYLNASPEKLNGEILFDVGKLFELGRGGKKDYAEMIKWFTQSADKGFFDAQFELATRYQFGIGGCLKDEKKSAEYYQKCAANANENTPKFQLCKGVCFQYGYGTEKNPVEAEKWLRKSVEQGLVNGQTALGVFLEGSGSEIKKRQEAVEWYKKAAEQNDVYAMIQLGNCYRRGFGTAPDDRKASIWLEKAAKTNNAEAQYQFAVWLDDSKQNYKSSAFQWFKESAEQGHVLAQFNVGVCYLLGKGIGKNKVEAEKWLRLAAEQNNETAAEALKVLDKF